MKFFAAIAIAMLFAVNSALAHYKPPVLHFKPPVHHVKAPAAKPQVGQASGGSWKGVTNALYLFGVCNLVGHVAGFVHVGITENRARTDKEVEFVPAACSVIGLVAWHERWKNRTPRPMLDVIDMRHQPIS